MIALRITVNDLESLVYFSRSFTRRRSSDRRTTSYITLTDTKNTTKRERGGRGGRAEEGYHPDNKMHGEYFRGVKKSEINMIYRDYILTANSSKIHTKQKEDENIRKQLR